MSERKSIGEQLNRPPTLDQISRSLKGQPLEVRLQALDSVLARNARARRRQRTHNLSGARDIVFSI